MDFNMASNSLNISHTFSQLTPSSPDGPLPSPEPFPFPAGGAGFDGFGFDGFFLPFPLALSVISIELVSTATLRMTKHIVNDFMLMPC